MLNKRNLKIAQFCSKESRYNLLKGIKVTPKATIATNGYYLVWVSTPQAEESNFPVVDGAPVPQAKFDWFILPADAAAAIEKAIPKKTTIPVLMNAAVSVAEGQPTIVTTDLDTPQVFKPKPIAGQFPNVDQAFPKDAPVLRIGMDARYLAQIAKFAAEFDDRTHGVVLTFYGPESPIRFDATDKEGQGMTALLMPLRMEMENLYRTYGYVAPAPAPEPTADEVNAELAEDEPVEIADVSASQLRHGSE